MRTFAIATAIICASSNLGLAESPDKKPAGAAERDERPAILPYEHAPTANADLTVRVVGDRRWKTNAHEYTGAFETDARLGIMRNLGIGVVGRISMVENDRTTEGMPSEDDVVAGFDDLRLSAFAYNSGGPLDIQAEASISVPTRSSQLSPGEQIASASLTLARRGVCGGIWLRPLAAASLDSDDASAGLELGLARTWPEGVFSLRGNATQLYRSEEDRLAGSGNILLAGRSKWGLLGISVESGFRPQGYVEIVLVAEGRTRVW